MPGRPKFEPSEKQRGMVQALVAAGYGEDAISAYLHLSPKTLRKHFRRELDVALTELLAGAANALGRLAVGAPAQFDATGKKVRDEVKPDLGAICFLLKTRGKKLGWTERLEHTGPGGGPMQTQSIAIDPEKLKGMSDDELSALERALGRLQRGDRGGEGGATGTADADAYSSAIDADEGGVAA